MQTLKITSSADSLELAVAFIEPSSEPCGIVQFVHGMCEHKERYYPFMNYLADRGFICVINDLRGHGESVKCRKDLGFMYKGGWEALVEDIEVVRGWAAGKWPGLEYTLFGHSMGSLAVRCYVKRYDRFIDRLFVCGSPSANPAAGAGKLLADAFSFFKGDHCRPALLQKLSFGAYNKPFADEGYASAWVCSDRSILEEYHHDPLCQYVFTANGFSNLLGMMKDCYSDKGWAMSNPDMPVYFISGEKDPCRGTDEQHQKSVSLMRKVGYRNVGSRIFSGMRHEILNETEREIVYSFVADHAQNKK